MPTTARCSRRRSGLTLPDVQLELPPLRLPSRDTHQSSSVPISVTRLSSVTGSTTSCCPVDVQHRRRADSVLPGRRPSPRSSDPERDRLADGRARESGTRPARRRPARTPGPGIDALVPSSIPNGTTHKRLQRRRHARHRRHRALDADVVGARRAAADADAAARAARARSRPRRARRRDRGPARRGRAVVERLEAFGRAASRSARRSPAPWSAAPSSRRR